MIFKKTIIVIHVIFLQFYYCSSESKIIKSQNTEEAPVIKKVEDNNFKPIEKESAQKKEMIFASIAGGMDHSCALANNGAIWCWGNNELGQLGDGSNNNSTIPVEVASDGDEFISISANGDYTCAMSNKQKIKCWGYNKHGQHTCILKGDGEVRCLGYNTDGELGDGTYKYKRKFVSVKHINNKAVQLAAGGKHACVIVENGIVKCWGSNENGMLGDGTTKNRNVPVSVKGITEKVFRITSGEMHTCALLESGAVKCWGHFYQG